MFQTKSKFLSILMLMFIMSVSTLCFTACGGDDDEEDSPEKPTASALDGRWRFDHATVTAMGQTVNVSLSDIKAAMPANTYLWDEIIVFEDGKMNGIPYKLKGKKLTLPDYPEFAELNCTVKVSDDRLVFHYDLEEYTGQKITEDLYYYPY